MVLPFLFVVHDFRYRRLRCDTLLFGPLCCAFRDPAAKGEGALASSCIAFSDP